jgi:hypothetical protein
LPVEVLEGVLSGLAPLMRRHFANALD